MDSHAASTVTGRARSLQNLRRGPAKPFTPGVSGNPKGRPKGSRQVISEKFLRDLAKYWHKNGRKVISEAAKESPSTMLRVMAGLLPAQAELKLQEAADMPQRTLEEVNAEIQAAIEERAKQLAEERSQAIPVQHTVVTRGGDEGQGG